MNRFEQLQAEMDPDTNALIPGGKAAEIAATNSLNWDEGPEADAKRLQSGLFNPLIPGSPRHA